MTARGVLLAFGVAAALLLVWFFLSKGESDVVVHIQRRARLDLVAACNQAAEASGRTMRFAPEDISARLETTEAESGVAAFVSVFEARRDGLTCTWNGLDPARIAPAD